MKKYMPLDEVPRTLWGNPNVITSITDPSKVLVTQPLRDLIAKAQKEKPPQKPQLLLLDFRTFCHPLYHQYCKWESRYFDQGLELPTDTYTAIYLMWLNRLTDIPKELVRLAAQTQGVEEGQTLIQPVICDDFPEFHPEFKPLDGVDKPIYWRHLIVPAYKAGRRPKPDKWDIITKAGYEAAMMLGYPIVKEAYMEADDLIAEFCRDSETSGLFTSTAIWTVDTDLLQLVHDREPCPVVWYNTPYSPFYRDKKTALEYWLKRWKTALNCPSEIAEFKAEHGDSSDNLLPGSPLGVIDLINPSQYPEMDHTPALSYPSVSQTTLARINKEAKTECLLKNLPLT